MKRNTKSALISSVLALLLCFTMLIGTTFAWFTDSVTSAGNKIMSGTLIVDLELLDKDGNWNSIKNNSDPIFNYENWEPGFTDVKVLKIENEGTLALKWKAKFVSANELSALAEVIDVFVCPSETELAYPADRNLDGYTKVGTVAEFVNTIEETTYGNLEAGEVAYLGIALKMQETAGNEYQGLDLGGAFDIQIHATQLDSEGDSFDNQYDAGLNPTTSYMFSGADLHNSTTKSGKFELSEDIRTSDCDDTARYGYGYEYIIRKGADYTLDLNGKTIIHDTVNENANHNAFTYTFVANHAGTKLTINGDGKIYANNSAGYTCAIQGKDGTLITLNGGDYEVDNGIAVWAGAGSHIVINGGSYVNGNANTDHELVYSSGGVIDIYGGFFHNTDGNYTLNVEDRNRATGFINVYGGTYVNFDPSTGGQDPNNIKVADGYMVKEETQENGDVWYTVVPVPEGYTAASTADEVTDALAAGEKVILEKDIEFTEALTINGDAEINLNGRTISTVGLNFTGNVTIENGTIESAGATSLVPHLSVNGGNLTMTDVNVAIDDYLNVQASGNRSYGEYTGMEVKNGTAVLNECSIVVKNEVVRTWNYVYGITVTDAQVTVNGGEIVVESVGADQTDLKTAVSAIGTSTVTLNGVDVQAETIGTTMGHLILNTTDTTVTDADFVSYGGTYELNYVN